MPSHNISDKRRFAANLRQQMRNRAMRPHDLAMLVGKTTRAIDEWLSANAIPKRNTLNQIEDIFDIASGELLEGVIDTGNEIKLYNYKNFADRLISALARTNSHLHHTNLSADYVIPENLQAEFYDRLEKGIHDGELEYHRVEVIRNLEMLEDVLTRLLRFKYEKYVQRVFLMPNFMFPCINAFMFDSREFLMGGLHCAAQTPCGDKPVVHATGMAMQAFMGELWHRVRQESVPINPLDINWKVVCLAASGMCWHFDQESGGMVFQASTWSVACDMIQRHGGQVELKQPQIMVQDRVAS